MFQSAVFDVYSCSHKTIHPGQIEKFSLGFKMKMPKGYCAKIYGRSGMTVKHGIHLAGGVSIIDPDFRGPISICLKTSHQSCPYKTKVNDWVTQMMIERVDEFEWIEGTARSLFQQLCKVLFTQQLLCQVLISIYVRFSCLFLLRLYINIYYVTLGNVARVYPWIVQGLTFLSA